MVNTQAHLDNTELNNRILWYDGDSTIKESVLLKMLTSGVSSLGLFVDKISNDIKQYNDLVSGKQKISIKDEANLDPIVWQIPEPFNSIDPVEYIITQIENTPNLDNRVGRLQRVYEEIVMYEDMHLMEMLSVLIYVINTLQTNNIVWGVGRGSSVSSYVLYLIGVHDVDSYAYDLQVEDFLH